MQCSTCAFSPTSSTICPSLDAKSLADPGPFCTRSLGAVDCWINPEALPTPQREVADDPAPTPAQERYRHARWPKTLTAD